MLDKIKKQWFMCLLVAVFSLVMLEPSGMLIKTGLVLKSHSGSEVIIFIIFIISGLFIEGDQIKAGIKDFTATFLALFLIVVVAPAAAVILSQFPLEAGMAVGIFIVAIMPTTLSSGVVMTGIAGGNMAHALFVTILSNCISILSIPLILPFILGFLNLEQNLDIDQARIIIKLCGLVLFPLIIGIALKSLSHSFSRISKSVLQIMNQSLILLIVFISVCSAKSVLIQSGMAFLYVIAITVFFHLSLLFSAFLLVKLFNIGKGRYESVVFMGAQKTLALSVMIQVSYFDEFGTALLVCIIHHIVHLMMDGYLSAKLKDANIL